ncbi:hypothetical protein BH10BAC4_BH10BAC4_13750 [soil metagenome]
MKNIFLAILTVAFHHIAYAQLAALPEPVANNAVVALQKNGKTVFYSFFGLDSTKKSSGVHNKVFRMDPKTGASSMIGKVSDVGRLAAAASSINNKAYVVGGYEVMANGKERSSNHLFIFDPREEKFVSGAFLPIPIDDHVQAVWRNKLLFVISGWSDSLTVNAVQVYDPAKNKWQLASSLPNEPGAKVFGGTGLIAGDTIYLLGGAMFAKNYPPSRYFYKGAIDPKNPLKVTWTNVGEYPGEFRYRSAAYSKGDMIYFIGGSNETYNYNGISYAESKKVEPNNTLLIYSLQTGKFETIALSKNTMDLRGVVVDENKQVFTLGGMEPGQKVSKWLIKVKFP